VPKHFSTDVAQKLLSGHTAGLAHASLEGIGHFSHFNDALCTPDKREATVDFDLFVDQLEKRLIIKGETGLLSLTLKLLRVAEQSFNLSLLLLNEL
jgi:hypothetical protein